MIAIGEFYWGGSRSCLKQLIGYKNILINHQMQSSYLKMMIF